MGMCKRVPPHFHTLLSPFAMLQVTSDGSGFGGAWHLDQIEVLDTVRGVSTVFPCGEWFEPKVWMCAFTCWTTDLFMLGYCGQLLHYLAKCGLCGDVEGDVESQRQPHMRWPKKQASRGTRDLS